MKAEKIVAVVQDVINGKHGIYVVTTSDEINGSITFSLRKEVWQERKNPKQGDYVVLSELHKKRRGWRAEKARFFSLVNGIKRTVSSIEQIGKLS